MNTIKAIETKYKGYRFRGSTFPMEASKRVSKRVDYTNARFGRLLVVECLGTEEHGYRWWGCVCDCGNRVAVRSRELAKVHTRSCGCLQAETRSKYPGNNKLPYGHASRNELLASYKKSAQKREILWALEDHEFFDIISSNCAYCGTLPDTTRKPNKGVNGEFVYSGIDRVDNEQGYIPGNVTSCCWNCNRAKGALGLDNFLTWCKKLSDFTAARSARFEHGENGAK